LLATRRLSNARGATLVEFFDGLIFIDLVVDGLERGEAQYTAKNLLQISR
jgi:hypothetical protein